MDHLRDLVELIVGQRREGRMTEEQRKRSEEQRRRLEAASGVGKFVQFVEKGETVRTKMGTVLDEVYVIVGEYKHLIQRIQFEEPYWDGSRIGYRTCYYTLDAKGKNIKFGQYTQFLTEKEYSVLLSMAKAKAGRSSLTPYLHAKDD